MESNANKPETIIRLTVACEGTPEESLQELTQLIENFGDKIKLLKLSVDAQDPSKKLHDEGPTMNELEKIQYIADRTKQIASKHKLSQRGKLKKSAQNRIPYLEEDLFFKALEVCDRVEVLFLINYNPGVTTNILHKAMEVVSGKVNHWGGNRQFIVQAILRHPKVTEDIIWLAVKSPYRSVQSAAIPKATLEMIDYLKTKKRRKPLKSTFQYLLSNRRCQLTNM